MKKTLYTFFVLFFAVTTYAQSVADSMASFFKQNPKTTSIYVIQNEVNVVGWNENETLPIAAMSDLLVAIEFAKQSAYKIIDTAERVPLKAIVKYYFENTNQQEYETWLAAMLTQNKVKDNTVSLMDVAQGMLQYGAQPNTEYLMDKIGFDNIKSSIHSYNLNHHTPIMAPVGALALYQNRVNTSPKKMLKAIDNLSDEEYCKSAFLMHLAIKNDSTFKNKLPKQFLDAKVLTMWSDKLPQASTKNYGQLLQTIVKEKMLDAIFYKMLRKVLEWPMQYSTVTALFDRFSMKGSATINTFSQAQYGKTKDGKEIVLVYTCAALKPAEIQQLTRWHQQFELQVFTNTDFVKKMGTLLKLPIKK
jgi:D-alanyl-D-alanine carboxypeptidase